MLFWIKKKIKRILNFLGLFRKKSFWPKLSTNKKRKFINNVRMVSSIETLNSIKDSIKNKKVGAYLRFGDGDIYLMLGKDDIFNKAHKKMAIEMKEAMKLKLGFLHKALPINSEIFGYEEGMKPGVHLVSDNNALKYLSVAYPYFDLKNIYTPVALHHLATTNSDGCVHFLKFLRNTNPIFVGNEKINSGLIEKLFGGVHVKTPSRDSYGEIDRIENELIAVLKTKNKEFQVVVVAMGCPGRILQKRILKKGYNVYLFDFGSLLDAFNGEDTRDWIELTGGIYYYFELLNKLDN